MFYPDVKRLDASRKLMMFAERIRNDSDREERDIFDQFRKTIETGDINKAGLFLDKNIIRYESRALGKAG